MRVGGHQRVFEARGVIQHYLLERARRGVEFDAGIHRPESGSGSYLIVATASGVKLGRDVADLLVQHAIDHRVHVFVGGKGSRTRSELLTNGGKPALDLFALLERDDSGSPEGDHPSL
jgi:hypothetical protein